MAIYRRYIEDLHHALVPTILRRQTTNIMNLLAQVYLEGHDALAQALDEFLATWPIDTAPTWVLDQHWLPYHGLQRNGLSDAQARLYIHAKRLLNKSHGAPNQLLDIIHLLLPTATTVFTYYAPKAWKVDITGVTIADAAPVLRFLEKKPSPYGGGFSVAGDNGVGVIADEFVLTFGSVHGVVDTSPGWFSSVHGNPPSQVAGWAHAGGV